MSKINLSELLKTKLDTLPQPDAATYFGVVSATISKWKNGTANPPVSALQKLVDEFEFQRTPLRFNEFDGAGNPVFPQESAQTHVMIDPDMRKQFGVYPAQPGADKTAEQEIEWPDIIGAGLGASSAPATLDEARALVMGVDVGIATGDQSAEFPRLIFGPDSEARCNGVPELLSELRPKLRVSGEANLIEVLRAILDGKWSRKVMMLVPSNRGINAHVMYSFLAQLKKQPWLGFSYKSNTTIQYARNVLSQRFLESEAEWAYWLDDDVAAPFGDPGFFISRLKDKKTNPFFAGIQTAERFMQSGKTIIGGVYAQREFNKDGESPLCIQPQLHPRHDDDRALVEKLHRGPFEEIIEVGYVATGCCMIHRSVFTDIQAKFPDLAPLKPGDPWNFFGNDVGKMGEDIHFCRLAAQAGHASWLDCAVRAAHLGNHAFLP